MSHQQLELEKKVFIYRLLMAHIPILKKSFIL